MCGLGEGIISTIYIYIVYSRQYIYICIVVKKMTHLIKRTVLGHRTTSYLQACKLPSSPSPTIHSATSYPHTYHVIEEQPDFQSKNLACLAYVAFNLPSNNSKLLQ